MEERREKWTPEAVVKYIKECRAGKGIPMFFTRYAGEQYKADGKLAARSSCWGGSDSGSVFWVGVPKEDIEMIERTRGDWRALLIKEVELAEILTPEQIKELEKVVKEKWEKRIEPLEPEFSKNLKELFKKWEKELSKKGVLPDYLAYTVAYILSILPSGYWKYWFEEEYYKAKKKLGEVV